MSSIFEEVYLYDYDEEKLTFYKRYQKPFNIEVIDESDKLLIRSRTKNNNDNYNNNTSLNNNINNNNNNNSTTSIQFQAEIYKDTPCSEFSKNGFVITDENGKSVHLLFGKKYIYDNEKANYKETDFCRFTKLVNDFKLGRKESVFTLRTDEASATQYFQFYGYLSQQQNMMQDYIRTSTYQRAILSNLEDFQNKIILDVGAGSGILSFFAVQAGARKVYAVEASSMAKHAEQLVASNKLADRIIVIPGKIEEISLPEQVDVIISEPMGYMLFNERMLETYLHAKKWLKPGGNMFPTRGDLHVAPFSDAQLYTEQLTKANFWFQQNFHGVDLTALRNAALKEYFYQPVVDTFDIRICVAKSNKYSVDFLKAHEKDLHVIDIPLKFHINQTDEIHGLAFWFDVAFFGSQQAVWLSTAPTQPLTHWYQVRCLIDKPLFVQRGYTVSGRVLLVSNRRQSYNVQIELQVDEIPGSHSSNSLDLKNPYFRYTGQPVQQPPGCNQTSPSEDYWQQIDAAQQQHMNGGNLINGVCSQPTNQMNTNGGLAHSLQPQHQQQTGMGHPVLIQQQTSPLADQIQNQFVSNQTNHHNNSSRMFGGSSGIAMTHSNAAFSYGLPSHPNSMPTNQSAQQQQQQQQPQQQTPSMMTSMFNSSGGGSINANSGQVAGINNMNFPVNQSLMIGDYAAAVSGQTIPPYKPI